MTRITISLTQLWIFQVLRPFSPGNAIARATTGEGSIGQFQDQAASFLLGTLHQSRVHLGLDTNSLGWVACLLSMTGGQRHTCNPDHVELQQPRDSSAALCC